MGLKRRESIRFHFIEEEEEEEEAFYSIGWLSFMICSAKFHVLPLSF
jgi:hypothetical protein